MKPYGREKVITGGMKWKTDCHPHPKHIFQNWWEGICGFLSRSTMKQKIKKEIEKEIMEFPLEYEQWVNSVCGNCALHHKSGDLYYCEEGRETTEDCEKMWNYEEN